MKRTAGQVQSSSGVKQSIFEGGILREIERDCTKNDVQASILLISQLSTHFSLLLILKDSL